MRVRGDPLRARDRQRAASQVQNFFLDLVSPVSSVFAKVFRPIKDGFVNLFHLPSLSKERADLQKEVAELRRQRIEAKELEAENQELKELLKWRRRRRSSRPWART